MSKRTRTDNHATNPKDYWRTPESALDKLVPHLDPDIHYVEPCAGDGVVVDALDLHGFICEDAYDIEPRADHVREADALLVQPGQLIVTNPPFRWELLQPLLDHWVGSAECWLLLPLDMLANLRCAPYMVHVRRMLPLGRVSWAGNGKGGMENYAWFNFAVDPQEFVLERV